MGVRTFICVGLVAVYFYTGTLGLLLGMLVWFGASYALTRLRSARGTPHNHLLFLIYF